MQTLGLSEKNIQDFLQKETTQMGLEPTTFGSEVRRAIHYATRPYLDSLCVEIANKAE
jgi:hypothetical protein